MGPPSERRCSVGEVGVAFGGTGGPGSGAYRSSGYVGNAPGCAASIRRTCHVDAVRRAARDRVAGRGSRAGFELSTPYDVRRRGHRVGASHEDEFIIRLRDEAARRHVPDALVDAVDATALDEHA